MDFCGLSDSVTRFSSHPYNRTQMENPDSIDSWKSCAGSRGKVVLILLLPVLAARLGSTIGCFEKSPGMSVIGRVSILGGRVFTIELSGAWIFDELLRVHIEVLLDVTGAAGLGSCSASPRPDFLFCLVSSL